MYVQVIVTIIFMSSVEPPQILPIPFPTPPPGETTVSTGQPMNTTVETGTSVTIYCPASGVDVPIIQWFKTDAVSMKTTMIVSGGRFTISTTTLPGAIITSVLRIDVIQRGDQGHYSCRAINNVGSDQNGTTLQTGWLYSSTCFVKHI